MTIRINKDNIEQLIKEHGKGEYTIIKGYENTNTPMILRHEKCGKEIPVIAREFVHRGKRCKYCSHRSYRKTTEEYKQEIYEIVGDEYILLSEYETNKKHVQMKHNTCGHIYPVTPVSFNRGRRCPECNGTKKKGLEGFKKEVKEILGDDYEVIDTVYKNNRTPVKMLHKTCGKEYSVTLNNLKKGNECPHCCDMHNSKPVKKLAEILERKGITFEREKAYKSCATYSDKTKRSYLMPFDFFIPSLNLLIEYDGELHFKGWGNNNEQLKKRQYNDEQKNKWVEQQRSLSLLRLTKDNVNDFEAIIDGFITNESSTTIEKYKLKYIE